MADVIVADGVEAREIEGFLGYAVTRDGRAWTRRCPGRKETLAYRWREMSPAVIHGKRYVRLTSGGVVQHRPIQRLLFEVFGFDFTGLDGEYRSVPGFPGYRISRSGLLESSWGSSANAAPWQAPWRVIKGSLNRRYVTVDIRSFADGTRRSMSLHRLVARAWLGSIPDGMDVCHCNGDPTDNRVENLRIDTRQANIDDRELHGRTARGSRHGIAKITESQASEIRNRLDSGETRKAVAAAYSLNYTTVDRIGKRKTWQHVL